MLAEDLYNALKAEGVLTASGQIKFEMMGIKTIVKTKSVVGDVIQDWLSNYLKTKGYDFSDPDHTQLFPDFYLNKGNMREALEVKCFDADKSPNFDVANFQAYCQSLLTNPERLDSYYLIFGYSMDETTYNVSLKNIWLKRVWEICSPSENWPIKFQIKKGMIYNIRPSVWYSTRSKYKSFATREEFVKALSICIGRYPGTNHLHRDNWYKKVSSGYKSVTGEDL